MRPATLRGAAIAAHLRVTGLALRGESYRENFLYFTRCGMIESCPKRRILSFS
jgi:hypothetical protein